MKHESGTRSVFSHVSGTKSVFSHENGTKSVSRLEQGSRAIVSILARKRTCGGMLGRSGAAAQRPHTDVLSTRPAWSINAFIERHSFSQSVSQSQGHTALSSG